MANINDGYGWGRLNVRQSLVPASPLTMQVRDDAAVGNGRTVRYQFQLPPRTILLRVTLTWMDPPGANVVNQLNLRVTATVNDTFPAQSFALTFVGSGQEAIFGQTPCNRLFY